MTEEEIRARVHQIVDIVLDGNGFESRQREKTGSLPTLFMRYSGHVNTLEVDLHNDGWESGQRQDREWSFRLHEGIDDETINSMANAVQAAYESSTEEDILRRDILRQEEKIKELKETLKTLTKTLKRKERKVKEKNHDEA